MMTHSINNHHQALSSLLLSTSKRTATHCSSQYNKPYRYTLQQPVQQAVPLHIAAASTTNRTDPHYSSQYNKQYR
jgi:hypothetical protein